MKYRGKFYEVILQYWDSNNTAAHWGSHTPSQIEWLPVNEKNWGILIVEEFKQSKIKTHIVND